MRNFLPSVYIQPWSLLSTVQVCVSDVCKTRIIKHCSVQLFDIVCLTFRSVALPLK